MKKTIFSFCWPALLFLPLAAFPQNAAPDAAGGHSFSNPATAICAAWAGPATDGEKMRRFLEALTLDAYVSARHGGTGFNWRDITSLLARVERICTAEPARSLAEVWQERKTAWHRGAWKANTVRCREILAAGDCNEDAFFFGIWLYAYDQAKDGRSEATLQTLPQGGGAMVWEECERTPDARLLDVLRRMQGK